MQCIMDAIPISAVKPRGMAPTKTMFLPINFCSFHTLPFFQSKLTRWNTFRSRPLSSTPNDEEAFALKNKTSRWHDQLQCWCLNFNERVTVASVKNFQLILCLENGAGSRGEQEEDEILQFGKVGEDIFTMDFQYKYRLFRPLRFILAASLWNLPVSDSVLGFNNFV